MILLVRSLDLNISVEYIYFTLGSYKLYLYMDYGGHSKFHSYIPKPGSVGSDTTRKPCTGEFHAHQGYFGSEAQKTEFGPNPPGNF